MASARPPLLPNQVPPLVRELYGFVVKVHQELDSYDDRNFLVEWTSCDEPLPKNITDCIQNPKFFLVKVISKKFSDRPDDLAMKNDLINHLAFNSFPTPCVVKNIHGTLQSVIKLTDPVIKEEANYVLKMLDYLPGERMDKVPLTTALVKEQGQLTGLMDKIWATFELTDQCVSVDEFKIFWNMSEMPVVRGSFQFVKDQSRVPLLEHFVSEFESKILTKSHTYSKGFIHSDVNDQNTIVQQKSTGSHPTAQSNGDNNTSKTYSVTGLIDFGDMTYSCHLYELAIGVAYITLNKYGVDPLEAAANFIEGYLENMPLSANELQHLRIAVCGRLVQSFVYGQVAIVEDQDNEYSQSHSIYCWPLLQFFSEMTDEQFNERTGLNKYFESLGVK